jgi:hypothetical protein
MKRARGFLPAFLAGILASQAQASIPKTMTLKSEVPSSDAISVPVPRPELSPAVSASVASTSVFTLPQAGGAPRLEVSSSSWIPDSVVMDSRLTNASTYHGFGVPQMSLTFVTAPLVRGHGATLSLLAGVSFVPVRRDGTWTGESGAPVAVVDPLYVVPARLGAEGELTVRGPWSLYADAAVSPTMGFTTRTVFNDGKTIFGLPFEASAGVANDLRWMSASLRGIQLKVGGMATFGDLTSEGFSGKGVKAGVSFPM